MGYRALARGILHIYIAADHRGAQRYSFLVEICDGKAEAERLCHKEKILSWNMASDACLRDDVYEYFIHSRIECASRVYIFHSTHSLAEVRYLVIEFIFES